MGDAARGIDLCSESKQRKLEECTAESWSRTLSGDAGHSTVARRHRALDGGSTTRADAESEG